MLFNSIEFLLFFPTVFILYWFVFNKNLRSQNILILLFSYIFYGFWDFRFLLLILISTIIDYFVGLNIPKQNKKNRKKILLYVSIFFNIGALCIFKYYNFFIDSWIELFNTLGYEIQSKWTLNIILPVGISFYTFQTLSYSIDIYRNKLIPTKDFFSFASFVAFFPQLVAGPIERASNLLPQILKKREFNYLQAKQGIKLIIWGMFKKVVIADLLAPEVDNIFSDYNNFGAGSLWIGAIFFSFQIYCDFSGYSDIAIGISKLLGIEIMSNFKFPYLSRNIGEFWRRWHISLSSWFRDYIYIPLGGSKVKKVIALRNIFIVFIISGLWHGANWTFVIWGIFHAALFTPSFLLNNNRKYLNSFIGEKNGLLSIRDFFNVLFTFILVTIGWVFFRSDNFGNAIEYLNKMFDFLSFKFDHNIKNEYLIILLVFIIIEFYQRGKERDVSFFKNRFLDRFFWYFLVCLTTLLFFKENPTNFIYFQF